MSWTSRGGLLLWSFGWLAGAASAGQTDSDLKLTVYIYNYSHISGQVVAQLERNAESAFRTTGVHMNWLNCHDPNSEEELDPACEPKLSLSNIIVRILSQPPTVANFHGELLGMATGRMADVYVSTAQRTIIGTLSVTLGAALAHELGHVLLGANTHSAQGIMHAPWDADDFHLFARGNLCFTKGQSETIRREVASRTQSGSHGTGW